MSTRPVEGSAIWDVLSPHSPHAAAADGKTLVWVEAGELCGHDTAESANLARIRPGLLAAFCHPKATEDDLTLITKWMAWLFLLDDRIDESDLGRDADLLDGHLQDLQGVALGIRTASGPMSRALEEIITQASAGMGDAWQLRFRRNISDYLLACVWQAAHRQAGEFPDPEVFPHWRRAFGAIMPSFDLIERTDGGALPSCVYYSRPYQSLLTAAADLVCWTNDLMTVDKEAAHGDLHNLVLVTEHDRHQDRRTASAAVSAACEQRMRAHTSARRDLTGLTAALGLPDTVRTHADDCAASLLVWVRGHLEWGLETPRYRPGTTGTGTD
ncbi:(-)-delta-cadinene synthase [Streptomyces clavuligerus]|uniref:(-)-delta-cadinene synthase n=1 Tax=Streptomyces clavuligerus TaxID=1901 RepID=DCADS_STRCL|nr:(-)-delta-cadinene synthase [Streptomyces clavuligerus]B5GS26.1 RecName: Full=(-)-delta-cadinene synthase [Streptomyces clavuligerus]EDY49122.1 terpene synthase [Streptomyces clavuligerus]EFG03819.1 Terpene synthase, metal-binding domain protein [Streptomyces clavuligerus]MBY6307658.1 (-)-delta-cadinene synthase [Streptomyces clavuligerus]QCS10896.1 isoprenoid biosynthesis protein [Streptomyces clavuligerus]QPJ98165.1 (-)-delta-cadinene synthase [Streptomyces clavuligerus]